MSTQDGNNYVLVTPVDEETDSDDSTKNKEVADEVELDRLPEELEVVDDKGVRRVIKDQEAIKDWIAKLQQNRRWKRNTEV